MVFSMLAALHTLVELPWRREGVRSEATPRRQTTFSAIKFPHQHFATFKTPPSLSLPVRIDTQDHQKDEKHKMEVTKDNNPNLIFIAPFITATQVGNKGLGLVVRTACPKGTLLITEKPLLHVSHELCDEDDITDLEDWIEENLNQKEQERLMRLADCKMWIGEKSFMGIIKTNGLSCGPTDDIDNWQYDHIAVHETSTSTQGHFD
jgi:hypothetical protein